MGVPREAASMGVWPPLLGGRLLPMKARSATWVRIASSPMVSPT